MIEKIFSKLLNLLGGYYEKILREEIYEEVKFLCRKYNKIVKKNMRNGLISDITIQSELKEISDEIAKRIKKILKEKFHIDDSEFNYDELKILASLCIDYDKKKTNDGILEVSTDVFGNEVVVFYDPATKGGVTSVIFYEAFTDAFGNEVAVFYDPVTKGGVTRVVCYKKNDYRDKKELINELQKKLIYELQKKYNPDDYAIVDVIVPDPENPISGELKVFKKLNY